MESFESFVTKVKNFYNISNLYPEQEKILVEIFKNPQTSDIFCILPTSAGKSLCYQAPALFHPLYQEELSVTIVVSPLISLIVDQYEGLVDKYNNNYRCEYEDDDSCGILPFGALMGTMDPTDYRMTCEALCNGWIRLLYITPEQINNVDFQTLVLNHSISINRVVYDEAHCLETWGQDFRPDYLNCVHFFRSRKTRNPIPVSIFTATANKYIRDELITTFNLKRERTLTLIGSSYRSNLRVAVIDSGTLPNSVKPIDEIINILRQPQNSTSSTIIYCTTRIACINYCKTLNEEGISAEYYHAGIEDENKKMDIFTNWKTGRTQVIVATIAFGMGIAKANVRFIFHLSMPKNIDNYVQEIGRAGRDGELSTCILFYTSSDLISSEQKIYRSQGLTIERRDYLLRELRLMYMYCVANFSSNDNTVCRHYLLHKHYDNASTPTPFSPCGTKCDLCIDRMYGENTSSISIEILDYQNLLRKLQTYGHDPKKSEVIDLITSGLSTYKKREEGEEDSHVVVQYIVHPSSNIGVEPSLVKKLSNVAIQGKLADKILQYFISRNYLEIYYEGFMPGGGGDDDGYKTTQRVRIRPSEQAKLLQSVLSPPVEFLTIQLPLYFCSKEDRYSFYNFETQMHIGSAKKSSSKSTKKSISMKKVKTTPVKKQIFMPAASSSPSPLKSVPETETILPIQYDDLNSFLCARYNLPLTMKILADDIVNALTHFHGLITEPSHLLYLRGFTEDKIHLYGDDIIEFYNKK